MEDHERIEEAKQEKTEQDKASREARHPSRSRDPLGRSEQASNPSFHLCPGASEGGNCLLPALVTQAMEPHFGESTGQFHRLPSHLRRQIITCPFLCISQLLVGETTSGQIAKGIAHEQCPPGEQRITSGMVCQFML